MAKPAAAPAKKPQSTWSTIEPFAFGGLSGMFATCCIQPIDMVKVRIQLMGEGGKSNVSANPFAVGAKIVREDGFLSLYRGLTAGLLRQATYTTARLGIFRSLMTHLEGEGPTKRQTTLTEKALGGLTAGGLGSIVGTPADVALIRMQADTTLPKEQRRNYKNVFHALYRIALDEGASGFFRGATPVVIRASALNLGMLASHDQALEWSKTQTSSKINQHLIAKFTSGFFASAFSLPFDFVKTRIQKQKPGPDGKMPYRNSMHCVSRVIAEEGPFAFYRGFLTYYFRIAPHVMITLVAYDWLVDFSKQQGWGK